MYTKRKVKTYHDLSVYILSYDLAVEIFKLTKNFPKEELFSLTNQIRRSSRSIPSNLAEGWAQRRYEKIFFKHLSHAIGSCEETKIWLDMSRDFKYVKLEDHTRLINKYKQVGAMLNSLRINWRTF